MNRSKQKSHSLWASFGFAAQGLGTAIRTERNMRIHLLAVVVITTISAFLSLTPVEWTVLVLTMGMVVAAELMNTAIEAVVDLACPRPHTLAAVAKNAAAAAVLVTAIVAVIVAWLMLWPKVLASVQMLRP